MIHETAEAIHMHIRSKTPTTAVFSSTAVMLQPLKIYAFKQTEKCRSIRNNHRHHQRNYHSVYSILAMITE